MVIELVASRILAPYIGISLYTWTSIIGVILAGIALGNYLGGRIADRYPSPAVLAVLFLAGSLATVATLPAAKTFGPSLWVIDLPVMWAFAVKIALIFFVPALVLSTVSPLVIKLTLANTGQTGGVVGTIYACSTAGSILGTFVTGFFLISWLGTRTIVWLVALVLFLTGMLAWFSWRVPARWKRSPASLAIMLALIIVIDAAAVVFFIPGSWREGYTRESNYYAIQVNDMLDSDGVYKELVLDHLVHGYIVPNSPTTLKYDYLDVFAEIVRYVVGSGEPLRTLHLGGGGYAFPRYLEAVYPGSTNDVVEIDPAVTQVAHKELGLPLDTTITTYPQDARLFLIQRRTGEKYDLIVGDVFSDFSTPYHLTTLEFNNLVKANLRNDGIYLLNIIDNYRQGKYLASFIYTLRQTYKRVYLFTTIPDPEKQVTSTFVIAATDRSIDLVDYGRAMAAGKKTGPAGKTIDEVTVDSYLADRAPVLLTDDYVPTDILVAPLVVERYKATQAASRLFQGQALLAQGRYDEAIVAFGRALEINPGFARAYIERGRVYGLQGQYDRALMDLGKAIETSPTDPSAYYYRGVAYHYQGQADQAIADFSKAIEFNVKHPPAYYYRGLALVAKGQYDEAYSDFSKAIELAPGFVEAYLERGRLRNRHAQFDEAIIDLGKAIELNPGLAEAYSDRGRAFGSKGQYDRAIADFSKAIELNPGFALAYYYRGVSYSNRQEHDRAIADLSRAIELAPDFPAAFLERGRAYYLKGERDKAVVDLKKVSEFPAVPALIDSAKDILRQLGQ